MEYLHKIQTHGSCIVYIALKKKKKDLPRKKKTKNTLAAINFLYFWKCMTLELIMENPVLFFKRGGESYSSAPG